MSWTLESAVDVATKFEAIAPKFGYHVGLTGGCLYRKGERQDCDLLIYRIRQVDEPDDFGFIQALAEIGLTVIADFGFCRKCYWENKSLDLLFPEVSGGDYQDPIQEGGAS